MHRRLNLYAENHLTMSDQSQTYTWKEILLWQRIQHFKHSWHARRWHHLYIKSDLLGWAASLSKIHLASHYKFSRLSRSRLHRYSLSYWNVIVSLRDSTTRRILSLNSSSRIGLLIDIVGLGVLLPSRNLIPSFLDEVKLTRLITLRDLSLAQGRHVGVS